MRLAFGFAAVAFVVAVAIVVACGGDDSSTATPTGSAATGTAHTITSTPQGQKTGSPNQQTASVPVTAPGETPTTPPVAAVGTPAVAPDDQVGFSTSFNGQQVDLRECRYNPTTAVVKCDGDLYAIDPPLIGQDITCTRWLIAGTPKAIACIAAEPPGTTYYEIQ